MNDQDYIRKAVELADEFSVAGVAGLFLHMDVKDVEFPYHVQTSLDNPAKFFLDALAAQLVRQVDESTCSEVVCSEGHCAIYDQEGQVNIVEVNNYEDRTMNTIKAIVDSDVLAAVRK